MSHPIVTELPARGVRQPLSQRERTISVLETKAEGVPLTLEAEGVARDERRSAATPAARREPGWARALTEQNAGADAIARAVLDRAMDRPNREKLLECVGVLNELWRDPGNAPDIQRVFTTDAIVRIMRLSAGRRS
jgi:hypothetical protein